MAEAAELAQHLRICRADGSSHLGAELQKTLGADRPGGHGTLRHAELRRQRSISECRKHRIRRSFASLRMTNWCSGPSTQQPSTARQLTTGWTCGWRSAALASPMANTAQPAMAGARWKRFV